MSATAVFDDAPQALQWLRSRVTGTLHTDSRAVGVGDAFIAWPGAATDGRAHVTGAFAAGAAACLVEHDGAERFGFDICTHTDADAPAVAARAVARCRQLKALTGPIAAGWFGAPSESLDVLAVTGTNGKTTTAWWLAQALSKVEHPAPVPCAVVGTLGIGIPPALVASGLTTPDPVLLQRALRRFVDDGLAAVAIEASSIGLQERRLDGTRIRVAIFTNFTQDHLDYHGSMDAYWQAKQALFDWPGLRAAVVNVDDPAGAGLATRLQDRDLDLWTFSLQGDARLVAEDIAHGSEGLRCTVVEGASRAPLFTQAIGHFNLYNLLGIVGAMRAIGVPLGAAVAACRGLLPVPGRMECVSRAGQPLVAVDYAHTPDALDKALLALRPLAAARGGALVCVFGCGGGRDAGKRPRMAAVAAAQADVVWITSDNPRHESPDAIIAEVLAGLPLPTGAHVDTDRARAIHGAIAAASPADVVLVAGKGHEAYMEIAGARIPFSDRAQVEAALDARLGCLEIPRP